MNKNFISITLFLFFLLTLAMGLKANNNTYINSSNIIYNEKENKIELAENSKININNINILIDRGIIDYENDKIEIFGNFYIFEDSNILSGKNLVGNANLDTVRANEVSYLYNNNFKIDSDSIKKNKNKITFYDNFLTPCKLDGYFNCPTWSLRVDKTDYYIEEDQFKHFDTFLQIADYKIFYLPYFTHYGSKAPRKKGFLTPTMEFNLEGEVGLITPLYLPINESSDLLIKPKFFLNQFFEKFSLNTLYERKNTGGNFKLEMDNISKKNDSKVNTSIRFNTKKIIDKNRIISASGLLSNNLSTTRSINEDSLAFEDIYLRIENYDFLNEKDYLKIDISGIESFETSSISSTIPILQNINYINNLLFNDKIISNDLDFIILQRDKSLDDSPSESFKISLKNEFLYNKSLKGINSLNKIVFVNNFNEHYFKHNKSLNRKDFNSNLIFSTSLFYNKFKNLTPRLKFILPVEISQSNNSINENSNSLTFNYHNQYSENRLFGYDLFDNTPRFVYGIESNFNFKEQSIIFAINQSYDLNTKSNYLSKINQTSNFSDYSLMMSSEYGGINFEINARLDEKNLSKKEMDYSITSNKLVNLKINYHETESESFQNFSKNTKSIDVDVSKKINDNFKIGYLANLDVKNNYNPYETSLKVSLFDECSQLDLVYSNKRFNDNFETVPEDVFSITFQMDYLGLINVGEYNNIFKNKND